MCEDREKVKVGTLEGKVQKVTQLTCQEACLKRGEDCVGISCSSRQKPYYDCTESCYLCKNRSIRDGIEGSEVFIKRPGNFKVIVLDPEIEYLS